MSVRVGDLLFHDWQSLEFPGGWSDTFVFRMASADGLPPADYAGVVRSLAGPLRKLRPDASLWVQVCRNSPLDEIRSSSGLPPVNHPIGNEGSSAGPTVERASWFQDEVRYALRGLPLSVAVTRSHSRPQIWDFSFFPRVDPRPYPRPPAAEPYLKEGEFRPSELACLRVLARSDCAYTAEITSLASLSKTGARAGLRRLAERRLVVLKEEGKYPLWKIRRPGLSLALRSWGLPPGKRFSRRRERGRDACAERVVDLPERLDTAMAKERITFSGQEPISFWRKDQDAPEVGPRRSSTGRHRRTTRLWPAWLRKAWPHAEIWAGWSEVTCGRYRPDALCWGQLDGYESLFWLEVESGNLSREELLGKTVRRVNQALLYARRSSVRLVFALLGPPWVLEAVRSIKGLPGDVAFVLEDWREFGRLPFPQWGTIRSGLRTQSSVC